MKHWLDAKPTCTQKKETKPTSPIIMQEGLFCVTSFFIAHTFEIFLFFFLVCTTCLWNFIRDYLWSKPPSNSSSPRHNHNSGLEPFFFVCGCIMPLELYKGLTVIKTSFKSSFSTKWPQLGQQPVRYFIHWGTHSAWHMWRQSGTTVTQPLVLLLLPSRKPFEHILHVNSKMCSLPISGSLSGDSRGLLINI